MRTGDEMTVLVVFFSPNNFFFCKIQIYIVWNYHFLISISFRETQLEGYTVQGPSGI